MRLVFVDLDRPSDDLFVINDRTDSANPIVWNGESFEVPDDSGRNLLARYYPRIQPA